MRSRLPKFLHPVGGLPLLEHALRAAESAARGKPIVVLAQLEAQLPPRFQGRADVVVQAEPRGTADALDQARSKLDGEQVVLVLPADMPLLTGASLTALVEALRHSQAGAAVLTETVQDASGYGRIVRAGDGRLARIVEDVDEPWDGSPAEVNCGAYAFALPRLWRALEGLTADNAQGELYLSWLPQLVDGGATTVPVTNPDEAIQVNDRVQLAAAEASLRRRTLGRLMLSGVTVTDPQATWIDCDAEVGEDTVIAPGSVIRGRSRIGRDCVIGPFAELEDVEIGDGCRVGRAHLSHCKLADGVDIGPFNRVRPESQLGPRSHLGTFTEVVRSRLGEATQVPHLSYVGDAELGADVNVGAGSITANWDGQAKHRTVVEEGARLGSGTILVAPVRVGQGAYTGAGSVITGDVPAGALAVARARQRNILGWVVRRLAKPRTGPRGAE
jgi:bifunctional UDP-N-acetylglucosamine pyrophosphorylase/glucosamine-1-phosphate N-acetyltransferase